MYFTIIQLLIAAVLAVELVDYESVSGAGTSVGDEIKYLYPKESDLYAPLRNGN
jgi:hypothetical protein